MKTCLIITGGTIDLDFAASYLKRKTYDIMIAVDAGLEAAEKLSILPDAAVGDFDTVNPDTLSFMKMHKTIVWEEHQPEKDETDTELALHTAVSMGSTDITLIGATGGRIDHALGNLHLLYPCLKKGIHVSIIDQKNRVYLLDHGKQFNKKELWGQYISFLPLTEEVRGITLTGFKYPLDKKDIQIGTSQCISNELDAEKGVLSFTGGILICVESHD